MYSGKRILQQNEATPFVYDYFVEKTLAKLGYSFDPYLLTDEEADILMLIDSTINKYDQDEMKKARKRHGRK